MSSLLLKARESLVRSASDGRGPFDAGGRLGFLNSKSRKVSLAAEVPVVSAVSSAVEVPVLSEDTVLSAAPSWACPPSPPDAELKLTASDTSSSTGDDLVEAADSAEVLLRLFFSGEKSSDFSCIGSRWLSTFGC